MTATTNSTSSAAVSDPAGPGSANDSFDAADFHTAQTRTPALDQATLDLMNARGISPNKIDPQSRTADQRSGHKIASLTIGKDETRTFGYQGSVRTDDGINIYDYDEKQHLIAVTQKWQPSYSRIRKIVFEYDGFGRMVGRRALAAQQLTPNEQPLNFTLETDCTTLTSDGYPAETTFVWDPLTDHVVAMYDTQRGTLLKQFIHADGAYDDAIEVTALETRLGAVCPNGTTTASISRYYPLFDEAGAGTMSAIVGADGKLIDRNLNTDPFGSNALEIAGAAVDHVEVKATKDQSGTVTSVDVTVRTTETLDPATIATGTRLAAVDKTGAVIRTSPVAATATANDAFTATWTLTPTQWTALTSTNGGATQLSIAVTDQLRASAWSNTLPILPPAQWETLSGTVFSSATLPVEARRALSSLNDDLTTNTTSTLLDIRSAATIATPAGHGALSVLGIASLHAAPFVEPMTAQVYFRNRWFDPTTAQWMTPDPMGYTDSANLYAFAGGDPVNRRDPNGNCWVTEAEDLQKRITETKRTIAMSGSWDEQLASTIPVLQQNLRDVIQGQSNNPCKAEDLVRSSPSRTRQELAKWAQAYATLEDRAERVGKRVWRAKHRPMDPSLVAEGADVRQQIARKGEQTIGDLTGYAARGSVTEAKMYGEGKAIEATAAVAGALLPASSATAAERLKASLAAQELKTAERIGSALKEDITHRAARYGVELVEDSGRVFGIRGSDGVQRTLIQVEVVGDGQPGVFEYIIEPSGQVSHKRFIKGGKISGFPNQKVVR